MSHGQAGAEEDNASPRVAVLSKLRKFLKCWSHDREDDEAGGCVPRLELYVPEVGEKGRKVMLLKGQGRCLTRYLQLLKRRR